MEMLANARKEADSHSTRIRDLEEMLLKEREARLHAEDMMQKMEVNNHTGKTNGVAGSLMTNGASELDMAFEPPMDRPLTPEPSADGEESEYARAQDDKFEASTAKFEARIDAMLDEMRGLREQLEAYRQRAEQAEQERDADRKTLAELVLEINRRNEEERLRKSERRSRSVSAVSTKGSRPASPTNAPADVSSATTTTANDAQQESPIRLAEADNDGMDEQPILSRANTTTSPAGPAIKAPQDSALLNTLPYASMIGVVLIGVGLMTYLNWQPQPRLDL